MSTASAYHESAHVLAAMRWLGHTPRQVSVGSGVAGKLGAASIQVTCRPRAAHTEAQWRRVRIPEAVMFLSGLAAEELTGHGRSRGLTELETIARVQSRGVVNEAMTRGLPAVEKATDDIEGALAALVDAFPTKVDPFQRLLRVYSFAMRFLATERPTLDRLASSLAARGALPLVEIDAIVGDKMPMRRAPYP